MKHLIISTLIVSASSVVAQTGSSYQPQSSRSQSNMYITNNQGQTTARIDSQGYITNNRGQTIGRIDSQGYITNTRGQTIERISR